MDKPTKDQREEAKANLRHILRGAYTDQLDRPIIYTTVHHVSRSGGFRHIAAHVVLRETGEYYSIIHAFSVARGYWPSLVNGRHICKRTGGGMDMGYDLACSIMNTAGLAERTATDAAGNSREMFRQVGV